MKVDRAAMAASLETRAPSSITVWPQLPGVCPLAMKIRPGGAVRHSKWALRQLLYAMCHPS